jgi:hypothetical protein
MEPERSLPFSQKPTTGPCPEPQETIPRVPILFPIYAYFLPSGLFHRVFQPVFCVHLSSHSRAVRPTHLILLYMM